MVKHKFARRALRKWAKEKGEKFTTNEAMLFLNGKSKKCYSLSQKQLNNVLGKTRKVKMSNGEVFGYRGELVGQLMVWEYVEYD